jgi:hypothetical protein
VLEALYTIPGQIAENRRRRNLRRGIEDEEESSAVSAS